MPVSLTRHDDIAVLTLDNPPVNALGPGVPERLLELLNAAAGDPQVRAIVIAGAGRTFCAGADIRQFEDVERAEQLRVILVAALRAIEDCPKPVVMAIHGSTLGGGLELAMAGHYRVAEPTAEMGQTEVKIGLIPGAAGTQRLPRLAGVAKAVEMCAFGEPITAREALALGLIDQIIEGAGAIEFARKVSAAPTPRTRERDEKLRDVDPALFASAREQARKTKRGQTAPPAAIDAVEAVTRLGFDEGCRREAELFRECLHSLQSKALIHAFFSERAAPKIPDLTTETAIHDIRRAAVIGAGTMGGGIAMCFANAGLPVILKEANQDALDRGMAAIRKNYGISVKKGRLSQAQVDNRLALIVPQLDYGGFDQTDVIVEAVFESLAVKKQVFSEIDQCADPSCILASNTSTLDIDGMAGATRRPEMVVGLHFYSPANVMRLLEVVRGQATSKAVLATSMALAKRLGKVAVLSGNRRGFIGNRTLAPYLREAELLVEEGASVEEVNQALYDFGMAMGPLAMQDLIGLDVWRLIRQELSIFEKPGAWQPRLLDRLCELGRFGQKTGRGWSSYDEARRPSPDTETAALIAAARVQRRRIPPEEIVERCLAALVSECHEVLKEGVALRAGDIDVVYLLGFGFPAWRGGPMFYGARMMDLE